MTLAEFQAHIFLVARNSGICTIPIVLRLTTTAIKVRVELVDGDYMDAFFNEVSGRTAFALIDQGERIFGADNAGGWHVHPFASPGDHLPVDAPISFAEFVAVIERHLVE
ncbi:MAG: hypothetical protein KBG20_03510 [Caldilineaceae bacterium]|nr:hypothetical protein [Caldilineaceae bacterium]MBP8110102.1 hypothetical protein [Caldilineaceae bacterium]MBP8124191.1 hypothetical protein [Caldilineaceae bacterium]MBP9071335.1 hypothetical protein [Caldilineaceae bacterium]